MSLRYKILSAVSKNPGATMDELVAAIDHDKQKVIWSVRDCANKNGLLYRERDDVTGQPGYHLTADGKARLAEGPDSKQGTNFIKKAQPAVATSNTGSDRSEPSSVSPSSEAVAVLEKPAPDAAIPVAQPVAADVIPTPKYDPDDVALSRDPSGLSVFSKLREILEPLVDPIFDNPIEMTTEELAESAVARIERLSVSVKYAHGRADALQTALDDSEADVWRIRDILGALVPDMYAPTVTTRELAESAAAAFGRLRNLAHSADPRALAHHETELANARALVDNLRRQLDGTVVHELDSFRPVGYIMTAAKRKPRRITCPDKARAAAESAIRSGAQRAEVFALHPVGRAVRGAEWRES